MLAKTQIFRVLIILILVICIESCFTSEVITMRPERMQANSEQIYVLHQRNNIWQLYDLKIENRRIECSLKPEGQYEKGNDIIHIYVFSSPEINPAELYPGIYETISIPFKMINTIEVRDEPRNKAFLAGGAIGGILLMVFIMLIAL